MSYVPPIYGSADAGRAALPVCRHCGAPSPSGEFCCAGCAYVYRLIHDQGLDAYYKIKDKVIAPAEPSLLQERDYGWLVSEQHDAERAAAGRTPQLILGVQGMSCAGCVWLIEKIFIRCTGAGRIEINAQTGRLRMTWVPSAFKAAEFAAELQRFGYLLGPSGGERPDADGESRPLVRRIGVATACAMNVMLFALPSYFGMSSDFQYARLFGTLAMAFGTLSLISGGGYFITRALRAIRSGLLHIDLPIALGIVGAYTGSFYGWLSNQEEYAYFDFVSGFILLMLIGRWAQVVAVERNQRRLLRHQPTPPRLKVIGADGKVTEVPPERLRSGDRFYVSGGQTVPVEGILETEAASLSMAWINGEPEPRVFRSGQRVGSGAQNVGRTELLFRATQDWEASLLSQLLKPSEQGEQRDVLLERVIKAYLWAILFVAGLSGIGWAWHTGSLGQAGAVVTAVLVVSCPCALGLAFPLADEMATVALRRRGVFVKSSNLWTRLAAVRGLVFDKTGTLTLETPQLLNSEILNQLTSDEARALMILVQGNSHPVSRSLHEALLERGAPRQQEEVVEEVIGSGVRWGEWKLGRHDWAVSARAGDGEVEGSVTFSQNGRIIAVFVMRDAVRSDAIEQLARLRARGLETHILSGDRKDKVVALGALLGIAAENSHGELSPHGKAEWMRTHGKGHAMMLGDGANDSLAFDEAVCRGTPVVHRGVLEAKADFYYLGRGLDGLSALFEINDLRSSTHRILLAFMVAYNLVAVGLAVAGHMHPLLAAVLMPLSSLATLVIVGVGMRRVM